MDKTSIKNRYKAYTNVLDSIQIAQTAMNEPSVIIHFHRLMDLHRKFDNEDCPSGGN